jgi:hypothetical protein
MNKADFVLGNPITIYNTHILAKYDDWGENKHGILAAHGDKLWAPRSSITIYFDRNVSALTITVNCARLFLSESYKRKPAFETQGWELAFERLPTFVQEQIGEYCDWIASQDGIDFALRMFQLKSFL